MANGRVLFSFKNWRLRRFNAQNLVIEHLGTYIDPKTKKEKEGWQFEGYYSTLEMALNSLADNVGFHADSLNEAAREIHEMRQAIERLLKVIE